MESDHVAILQKMRVNETTKSSPLLYLRSVRASHGSSLPLGWQLCRSTQPQILPYVPFPCVNWVRDRSHCYDLPLLVDWVQQVLEKHSLHDRHDGLLRPHSFPGWALWPPCISDSKQLVDS